MSISNGYVIQCSECGDNFKKMSIKSQNKLCDKCKRWRRDFMRMKGRGTINRAEKITQDAKVMIEDMKTLKTLMENINIEQIVHDRLREVVLEEVGQLKKMIATVNSRVRELAQKMEGDD